MEGLLRDAVCELRLAGIRHIYEHHPLHPIQNPFGFVVALDANSPLKTRFAFMMAAHTIADDFTHGSIHCTLSVFSRGNIPVIPGVNPYASYFLVYTCWVE
jgi:hypothetical protein